jgi:hypothetical protein
MSIAGAAAQPNRMATSRLLAANFTACILLLVQYLLRSAGFTS